MAEGVGKEEVGDNVNVNVDEGSRDGVERGAGVGVPTPGVSTEPKAGRVEQALALKQTRITRLITVRYITISFRIFKL